MHKAIATIALLMTVSTTAAVRADELAVDEPLNANARQNVRPVDDLVVDRAYDLFADPRVRSVRTVAVVPAVGEPTNAKVRAAATMATRPTATTRGSGAAGE